MNELIFYTKTSGEREKGKFKARRASIRLNLMSMPECVCAPNEFSDFKNLLSRVPGWLSRFSIDSGFRLRS